MKRTYTRTSLPPSWATRVLLPTISEGQTISSRIFSWTAVRVRERGRFWPEVAAEFRLGLGRTRRWERKMMYLSESFFSSSRVSLCDWARWDGRALRRVGEKGEGERDEEGKTGSAPARKHTRHYQIKTRGGRQA